MNTVIVAYEDKYCAQLHLLVKRLRKDRHAVPLIIEPWPVKGTGNFARDVPFLLRKPLPKLKLPDRLVCVSDADRPGNLVPGAAAAPGTGERASLDAWVVELETAWHKHLVKEGRLAEAEAAKLRTVCLRWNKESLLIACPEALSAHAGKFERNLATEALFAACKPSPYELADAAFVTAYRNPEKCMDLVLQRIDGRNYKKGRDDEDILREQILAEGAQARRDMLWRRCPDLDRLLAAIA